MSMILTFTGATGTVTGSHYVLDSDGGGRMLLDCGLYQGGRELRERNWAPFPVPPASIQAVALSHAHIDHTGYLPRLIRDGCAAPVYASAPTKELCRLLLPDSARLMEEEASYRQRKGASRHNPPLPLYNEAEANTAVNRIQPVEFGAAQALPGGASLRLHHAGHILGSAFLEVTAGAVSLLFTGDIGRTAPAVLDPAETIVSARYLMLESTYGNRLHTDSDPRPGIEQAVTQIVQSGGVLVIPAFAVGRTQELLYLLRGLEDAGRIPSMPVAVDSPMAIKATALFEKYGTEMAAGVEQYGSRAFHPKQLLMTETVEQSKALNAREGPMIILSASGMATGGRILHHLRRRLPDPRNGVLIAGYQAEGSRGRLIQEGAETVTIFGEAVPVRAHVTTVDALSAHADQNELMAWLRGFTTPPRRTFLVHGENDARTVLAARIQDELGWDVHVPTFGEKVALD